MVLNPNSPRRFRKSPHGKRSEKYSSKQQHEGDEPGVTNLVTKIIHSNNEEEEGVEENYASHNYRQFLVPTDQPSLSAISLGTAGNDNGSFTTYIPDDDTLLSLDVERIERLLSSRLLGGYCLLEKSCPACSVPLVKLPFPQIDENGTQSNSFHHISYSVGATNDDRTVFDSESRGATVESPSKQISPIPGVPFCVYCEAHVVTDHNEVEILEDAASVTWNKRKGHVYVGTVADGTSDETGVAGVTPGGNFMKNHLLEQNQAVNVTYNNEKVQYQNSHQQLNQYERGCDENSHQEQNQYEREYDENNAPFDDEAVEDDENNSKQQPATDDLTPKPKIDLLINRFEDWTRSHSLSPQRFIKDKRVASPHSNGARRRFFFGNHSATPRSHSYSPRMRKVTSVPFFFASHDESVQQNRSPNKMAVETKYYYHQSFNEDYDKLETLSDRYIPYEYESVHRNPDTALRVDRIDSANSSSGKGSYGGIVPASDDSYFSTNFSTNRNAVSLHQPKVATNKEIVKKPEPPSPMIVVVSHEEVLRQQQKQHPQQKQREQIIQPTPQQQLQQKKQQEEEVEEEEEEHEDQKHNVNEKQHMQKSSEKFNVPTEQSQPTNQYRKYLSPGGIRLDVIKRNQMPTMRKQVDPEPSFSSTDDEEIDPIIVVNSSTGQCSSVKQQPLQNQMMPINTTHVQPKPLVEQSQKLNYSQQYHFMVPSVEIQTPMDGNNFDEISTLAHTFDDGSLVDRNMNQNKEEHIEMTDKGHNIGIANKPLLTEEQDNMAKPSPGLTNDEAKIEKTETYHEKTMDFPMPEYEIRRDIATKVLGAKMMIGYSLKDEQCKACLMPMMVKDNQSIPECVVCPTLRRKAAREQKLADQRVKLSAELAQQQKEMREKFEQDMKNAELQREKLEEEMMLTKQRQELEHEFHKEQAEQRLRLEEELKRVEEQRLKIEEERHIAEKRIKLEYEMMEQKQRIFSKKSTPLPLNDKITSPITEREWENSFPKDEQLFNKIVFQNASDNNVPTLVVKAKENALHCVPGTDVLPDDNPHVLGEMKSNSFGNTTLSTIPTKGIIPKDVKILHEELYTFSGLATNNAVDTSEMPQETKFNSTNRNETAPVILEADILSFLPLSNDYKQPKNIEQSPSNVYKNDIQQMTNPVIDKKEISYPVITKKWDKHEFQEKSKKWDNEQKNQQLRHVEDEEAILEREMEAALKTRARAEAEVRRLAEEKKALDETALTLLEEEFTAKQKDAEEALTVARAALSRVKSARNKVLEKHDLDFPTSSFEGSLRSNNDRPRKYHDFPRSETDLQTTRWSILRDEARSVMTRKMMKGWTIIPEFCRGRECENAPLMFDGNRCQCVVCGGTGNGKDGMYLGSEDSVSVSIESDSITFATLNDDKSRDAVPRVGTWETKSSINSMTLKELQVDFDSKRNTVSKDIRRRMMKGWKLLDLVCQNCAMPLMTDPECKHEFCVLCGVVGKVEIVEPAPKKENKSKTKHVSSLSEGSYVSNEKASVLSVDPHKNARKGQNVRRQASPNPDQSIVSDATFDNINFVPSYKASANRANESMQSQKNTKKRTAKEDPAPLTSQPSNYQKSIGSTKVTDVKINQIEKGIEFDSPKTQPNEVPSEATEVKANEIEKQTQLEAPANEPSPAPIEATEKSQEKTKMPMESSENEKLASNSVSEKKSLPLIETIKERLQKQVPGNDPPAQDVLFLQRESKKKAIDPPNSPVSNPSRLRSKDPEDTVIQKEQKNDPASDASYPASKMDDRRSNDYGAPMVKPALEPSIGVQIQPFHSSAAIVHTKKISTSSVAGSEALPIKLLDLDDLINAQHLSARGGSSHYSPIRIRSSFDRSVSPLENQSPIRYRKSHESADRKSSRRHHIRSESAKRDLRKEKGDHFQYRSSSRRKGSTGRGLRSRHHDELFAESPPLHSEESDSSRERLYRSKEKTSRGRHRHRDRSLSDGSFTESSGSVHEDSKHRKQENRRDRSIESPHSDPSPDSHRRHRRAKQRRSYEAIQSESSIDHQREHRRNSIQLTRSMASGRSGKSMKSHQLTTASSRSRGRAARSVGSRNSRHSSVTGFRSHNMTSVASSSHVQSLSPTSKASFRLPTKRGKDSRRSISSHVDKSEVNARAKPVIRKSSSVTRSIARSSISAQSPTSYQSTIGKDFSVSESNNWKNHAKNHAEMNDWKNHPKNHVEQDLMAADDNSEVSEPSNSEVSDHDQFPTEDRSEYNDERILDEKTDQPDAIEDQENQEGNRVLTLEIPKGFNVGRADIHLPSSSMLKVDTALAPENGRREPSPGMSSVCPVSFASPSSQGGNISYGAAAFLGSRKSSSPGLHGRSSISSSPASSRAPSTSVFSSNDLSRRPRITPETSSRRRLHQSSRLTNPSSARSAVSTYSDIPEEKGRSASFVELDDSIAKNSETSRHDVPNTFHRMSRRAQGGPTNSSKQSSSFGSPTEMQNGPSTTSSSAPPSYSNTASKPSLISYQSAITQTRQMPSAHNNKAPSPMPRYQIPAPLSIHNQSSESEYNEVSRHFGSPGLPPMNAPVLSGRSDSSPGDNFTSPSSSNIQMVQSRESRNDGRQQQPLIIDVEDQRTTTPNSRQENPSQKQFSQTHHMARDAIVHPHTNEKLTKQKSKVNNRHQDVIVVRDMFEAELEAITKDARSVGSDTLDGLLARIEKTKEQIAKTKEDGGSQSQYQLRSLIDSLAKAAEQMEQYDDGYST